MQFKVLVLCAVVHLSWGFPAKLLRVPKIYNALITTKQKLLPSEAFPASTGPVFQPIGLTGEPVLLNPEAFAKKANRPPEDASSEGEIDADLASPEKPRPFSTSGESKEKMPAPIVFYPKYSVYHPYQPVLPYSYPYQDPFVYSPYGNPQAPIVQPIKPPEPAPAPEIPREEVYQGTREPELAEAEEEPPAETAPSVDPPSGIFPPQPIGGGYVKNNRPKISGIPDVPPPPPPVGAAKPQVNQESEDGAR